eukprot:15476299-Alexandrium_andersonii.AAC.1
MTPNAELAHAQHPEVELRLFIDDTLLGREGEQPQTVARDLAEASQLWKVLSEDDSGRLSALKTHGVSGGKGMRKALQKELRALGFSVQGSAKDLGTDNALARARCTKVATKRQRASGRVAMRLGRLRALRGRTGKLIAPA